MPSCLLNFGDKALILAGHPQPISAWQAGVLWVASAGQLVRAAAGRAIGGGFLCLLQGKRWHLCNRFAILELKADALTSHRGRESLLNKPVQ